MKSEHYSSPLYIQSFCTNIGSNLASGSGWRRVTVAVSLVATAYFVYKLYRSRVSPISNDITTPEVLHLPKMTAPKQTEEIEEHEVASRCQPKGQKTLAATKDQRIFRGDLARLPLKQIETENLEEKESSACIKIQSVWRGHLARVKAEESRKHVLSYALLEKAKPYIDALSNRQDIPRASSGKTSVYLPKELPIVLKHSGSPANQTRFDQMRLGRDICEKSGYKHLVIPKARIYGSFIVESRLPITMHGTKEQIGLYIENLTRFAGAVEEFTGFLCQSDFDDITGRTNDPYGTLSITPIGRYDNIALYLEEDQGKIGLIDLARFKPGCSTGQKNWCFLKCRDAVRLFPYHLEGIMSVASRFDSNIEFYRKDLEIERDGALKRFKLAYENHLEFVKKKGIRFEDPISFEKLGEARTGQIQKVIEEKLREEHEGLSFKGCLGERPDDTLSSFNKTAFPQILNATYTLIKDSLESNLKNQKDKGNVSTNAELLSLRTLEFSSQYVVYDDFIESTSNSLEMIGLNGARKVTNFLNLLLDVILKELEKGGEIAYYNPSFGYGDYATQCVFC